MAATAITEEEGEEHLESESEEERQYYYEQIKANWDSYRKRAIEIREWINKVISSYHDEHPDWSATNIVRHIAADLWELHDQGLSRNSIFRFMDNENRKELKINLIPRGERLFYKKDSKEIDKVVEAEGQALVQKQNGEQPDILMKNDEHMQCFQREQTLKIENKALKKELKNSRRVVFPLKLLQDYCDENNISSPGILTKIVIIQENGKAIKVVDR